MQNIHPLLVHFPIALLSVGVVTDLIGVARRSSWMRRAGLWMHGVGVAAASLAVASGLYAERTAGHIESAHDVLERHELAAFVTLGVFVVLLLWRLWRRDLFERRGMTVVYVAAAAIGLAAVLITGKLGGDLVYEYGVGTAATAGVSDGHAHDEEDKGHDDTDSSMGAAETSVRTSPGTDSSTEGGEASSTTPQAPDLTPTSDHDEGDAHNDEDVHGDGEDDHDNDGH